MKTYLVGGAVRDELLGRPVQDRDWVVVGTHAHELLRLGFRQVGRGFPVFLHPETGEEHALARREWKIAPGHRGFDVRADPEVTLEQDLIRRDLTINAMAKGPDQQLIDPFGGQRDIASRTLRHVGEAFREDPLRVFRVARFAAELPGFSVHASTLALMSDMSDSLDELPAERVWAEFRKALAAPKPQRFVQVLNSCGNLQRWFPELRNVEVDVRPTSVRARYGALGWVLSEERVSSLSTRLKVPNDHASLAREVARHGRALAAWRTAKPTQLLAAAKSIGTFHELALSWRVLDVVGAIADMRLDNLARLLRRVATEIDVRALRREGLAGRALGQRIEQERIKLFTALRKQATNQ